MDAEGGAEAMWVPWYRIEAGQDGLLIIGQDDESFALDEEDGVEAVVEVLNRLWNTDHDAGIRARNANTRVEQLQTQVARLVQERDDAQWVANERRVQRDTAEADVYAARTLLVKVVSLIPTHDWDQMLRLSKEASAFLGETVARYPVRDEVQKEADVG